METNVMTCNEFDDLLLEGDDASMEKAAQHAAVCAECGEKLKSWKEISEIAPALHATWQSDLLLPRIQREISKKPKKVLMWQVAAVLILTFGIGGGTCFTVRVRRDRKAFEQAILRTSALEQVEAAEKQHLQAIEQLERVAGPKLEEPQTPLLVSYKEKLMLLDDAIGECQSNIKRNRENAYLRKQLLAIYSEKQKTLKDVLGEDSHVTYNP